MIKVIDNFLSPKAYNDLIAQIACGPFEDEINPIDGVLYPHICKVIPKSVTDEVSARVPGEFTEFMRSSPKGVHCPNPVHHDLSMGKVSIMVYTSTTGGTAIMKHNYTGAMAAAKSQSVTKLIGKDTANWKAWKVMEIAEAKPNRAAIFDASLLHAALPLGGYGDGSTARTVYTRFVK